MRQFRHGVSGVSRLGTRKFRRELESAESPTGNRELVNIAGESKKQSESKATLRVQSNIDDLPQDKGFGSVYMCEQLMGKVETGEKVGRETQVR